MLRKILYCLRVFVKLFFLAFFAAGTLIMSFIVFPITRLFIRDRLRFQKTCRRMLGATLRFFVRLITVFQIIKIRVSDPDRETLRNLHGAIVVSNHPSFFDSALLISLQDCTDFIVKSALKSRNVMSLLIRTLYIPNSMKYEEIMARCKENLASGGTLTLFPEGTRSINGVQNRFKKGAARISLATGCPIVPVYIGGNSKRGLGKGDKFYQVNENGAYRYEFIVKDAVYPEEFAGLSEPIAAKRFTAKLQEILSDENNRGAQYE